MEAIAYDEIDDRRAGPIHGASARHALNDIPWTTLDPTRVAAATDLASTIVTDRSSPSRHGAADRLPRFVGGQLFITRCGRPVVDDHHGAAAAVGARVAHRTAKELDQPITASCTDHEKTCVGGAFAQRPGRVTVKNK